MIIINRRRTRIVGAALAIVGYLHLGAAFATPLVFRDSFGSLKIETSNTNTTGFVSAARSSNSVSANVISRGSLSCDEDGCNGAQSSWHAISNLNYSDTIAVRDAIDHEAVFGSANPLDWRIPITIDYSLFVSSAVSADDYTYVSSGPHAQASVQIGGAIADRFSTQGLSSRGALNNPVDSQRLVGMFETEFLLGSSDPRIIYQLFAGAVAGYHAQAPGPYDGTRDFSVSVSAFADPTVTIDPTWEFADLFSVSNTATSTAQQLDFGTPIEEPEPTPVPEPGTLPLLGLGVAGLLLANRRQRRLATAV